MSSRCPRALGALVALVSLFTAGYLAPYLLPTVVGRLSAGLGLGPAQAGLVGSILLLGSASAGFTFAARASGARWGHALWLRRWYPHPCRRLWGSVGPRRAARLGLLLMLLGYGTAAATGLVPLVVAGAVVGGFGSGTATAVAAAGIAGRPDPHRASSLGLLSVSAAAGALYLTLPHLGGGHALPFAAIAGTALLVAPTTVWLPDGRAVRLTATAQPERGPLPHRVPGTVLAGAILLWSMAQNALWGVSGRIGLTQAGLSEVTLGLVFAVALGAGLVGVIGAGVLGSRLGRAVPIGVGTALIAACVLLSSAARGPASFAAGEIAWNAFYPVVLSYLLGLAASLDPHGRWAVLVGSASSLGVACGPVTGSLLSEAAGYPGMGLALCALLLLIAAPMTAVARHASGRPLVPGSIHRRGGAPAAVLSATTTPTALVPQMGAPEQQITPVPVPTPAAATRRRRSKSAFRLAGRARG
ncbi:MFS transporter [Streptomyces sp. SKN60]|uniref:MFS transporter n=1 Tax=Streptomyces sp. SKN60 TaxID=2855506 RepID=UPI0035AC0AD2|nr:MFS transporter [Streptomyces sp. SKN60]